jgi:hypothetical protein
LYRIEQKEFGEAVDRLNQIPEKDANSTTKFLLGKGFFGLELYDKAIAAYQQAVATDPEFYNAWVELGLTYEIQKNYIDAERVFSKIFEMGLGDQQILFRLIELNLKLNNPDQACPMCSRAPTTRRWFWRRPICCSTRTSSTTPQTCSIRWPAKLPSPRMRSFLAILEYEGRDNPDKALAYLESIPASHQHYERSLIFRIHLLYQLTKKPRPGSFA